MKPLSLFTTEGTFTAMKHCWGLNAVSRLGPLYSLITCGTLIMHQSYKCRGAGYCHTARAILSIIDEVCVSKYIINLPVRTTYLPLEVSYIATSSSFCFVRSIYSIHCMPAKMKKHPWLVGKKAHTVSVISNLCTYAWSIYYINTLVLKEATTFAERT